MNGEETINGDSHTGEQLENSFGAILGDREIPRSKVHTIKAIINPAAGRDQPILKVLNAVLTSAGVDWDIALTKKNGDGARLAKQAVQEGAEIVIVHGGDGTVMDVASGVAGSGVPLAIIPGGTANVMSHELGVPLDILEACILAVNPEAAARVVDMGQVGDHLFMLRAGMGFEAAMVQGANRELKDRLGLLAYALSALQELADPQIARYRLNLDGQAYETEGLACIIANSGNVGRPGMTLAPTIDVSDGLLDVIVVTRADLPSLVSLAASVVSGNENSPALQHWQAREIQVESNPVQSVQLDGEMVTETPIQARVWPGALKVIVPPQSNP